MSFTQSDLDKLERAIAQGVTRVKYTDKEVTYRSLSEMKEIRRMMRRELKLDSAPRTTWASVSKGLQ